jgi:hypothetical protein
MSSLRVDRTFEQLTHIQPALSIAARFPPPMMARQLLELRTQRARISRRVLDLSMASSRSLNTNLSASRSIRSCRCRKLTWQVRWTEEASGLDGSPVATNHWEAALDTMIISATSDASILENPLGFYVTQLNWTEQRVRRRSR